MDSYAFIDECGSDGMKLGSDGTTGFYVVAAVVISANRLAECRGMFDATRARWFPHAKEMSSAGLRGNDERRLKVIGEVARAPFGAYLLVLDRSRVRSKGFWYPKSFVKYLHGRLYNSVTADHGLLHLRADRLKNPPFMAEFRSYLDREHPPTLWSNWSHKFVDSEEETCVQAADIIAGSVARCYEGKNNSANSAAMMAALHDRIVHVDEIPPMRIVPTVDASDIGSCPWDGAIEARAIDDAYAFIAKHEDTADPEAQAQVYCLQMLLSSHAASAEKWVSTRKLCESLADVTGEPMTTRKLRLQIIGKLRDRGILIASNRRGGYKVPIGLLDLTEFVNTQNEKIKRMVERTAIARRQVLRVTEQQIDILQPPQFRNLALAVQVNEDPAVRSEALATRAQSAAAST